MNTSPKFYTKRNRLTRYSLACGYVERAEADYKGLDYRSVTLGMSGSVIHALTYRRELAQRLQFGTQSITEARKVFAQECRATGLKFHAGVRTNA